MITASYSNGTGAVNFYLDGITDGSATAHSGAALGRDDAFWCFWSK